MPRACRYCGGELFKHPVHPTWYICPACEPRMGVVEVSYPKRPDTRGAPSKPGGKQ